MRQRLREWLAVFHRCMATWQWCVMFIMTSLFLYSGVVSAADITFGWNANTEEHLTGYKMHRGTERGVYTVTRDVGNATEYNWTINETGKFYFAVTAVGNCYTPEQGSFVCESGYSNVVYVPTVPAVAKRVR
jgi:hypothetical protein